MVLFARKNALLFASIALIDFVFLAQFIRRYLHTIQRIDDRFLERPGELELRKRLASKLVLVRDIIYRNICFEYEQNLHLYFFFSRGYVNETNVLG